MPADPARPALSEPEGGDMCKRPQNGGPAVAARVLGSALRDLRVERRMRLSDVAPHIRASVSKLSRMERGESAPSARDVHDLIKFYGVGNEDRANVETLLDRVAAGPFAAEYADITPGWFRRMIGLEVEAAQAEYWEGVVVPGPLQTRRYAAAIIQAGRHRAPSREVERRVQQRMDRAQLLYDKPDRTVVALLDESVLHRNIGSPKIMIEQLEHLQDLGEHENVYIRILPFAANVTPPPMAFARLGFEYGGPGDIIYVEGPGAGATYLSKPHEVDHYRDLLRTLMGHVADRTEGLALIKNAISVHGGRLRGTGFAG
ncbi:helix-turn-helix domain-containing protein [Kitasatospora sp. NPDC058046]|uniref:helix-turn-helix domain-containing protein n=1 Tax=Kitasatospora sp. NPDC058046 TaxID=3346312 RepID=UPI0036DB5526